MPDFFIPIAVLLSTSEVRNDRCAAGTGKFLEVMAKTLEVEIDNLGELALSAEKGVHINSLCTVFADSEVISLIARGENSNAIALGINEAIISRIVNMVKRVGCREQTVFAGGAALNRCLRQLLEDRLNTNIVVPPEPQTVGALGAALLAKNGQKTGENNGQNRRCAKVELS